MAVFDTAHRDLYIACTGDCRAVAGVWEKTADGKGQWRVEVLSEDQTGRNPNELKRYDPDTNEGSIVSEPQDLAYNQNTRKMKLIMLSARDVSWVVWSRRAPLGMLGTNGPAQSKKRV